MRIVGPGSCRHGTTASRAAQRKECLLLPAGMPTKHPGEIIAQTRQPGVVLVGTSSRLLRSRRYSYYREQPGLNVHEQAAPSRVPVQLSPWPAPRPVAGNGKAEQPTQAGPTSRT